MSGDTEVDFALELQCMAYLLERNFSFDESGLLFAYQSDSTNMCIDGKYVGNTPGALHHPFIVNWTDGETFEHEKAFLKSVDAAQFYIEKKKELVL